MNYAIKTGFNQDEEDLIPFNPQPRMPNGIEYPEIAYGGDLSASQIGTPSFVLVWSNTMSRYNMNYINTQAGLNAQYGSEVDYAEVTVRVRDNNGDPFTGKDDWIIVNAIAQRVREMSRFTIGWNNHSITFQVVGLAA